MAEAAVCHTRTFPLQVNQCGLDPALSGSLLALPLTKATIGIWDLTNSKSDPVSLTGHRRPLSALTFSHDEPKLLCSVAEDYVIIWNVPKCLHNAAKGSEVRGEVILSHPGDVSHVCFSTDAARVALCVDAMVKVANVSLSKVVAELAGHSARVTAAEFCPHFSATLVTISDDRTVIIWDVQNLSLIYQSAVLSSAPLIALAMNKAEAHVAVASASGMIKVFDLEDDRNFRQLCQLDAGRMLFKFRQSQPSRTPTSDDGPVLVTKGGASRKTETQTLEGGDAQFSSIESSDSVLSLLYAYTAANKNADRDGGWSKPNIQTHGAVNQMLSTESVVLVVVSSHCMIQVDSRTLEALVVVDFQQSVPSSFQATAKTLTIGGVGLAGTGQVSDQQLVVVVGTQFESRVHSIQWELVSLKGSGTDRGHGGCSGEESQLPLMAEGEAVEELSMVAARPLTENSPLKAEFQTTSTASATNGNRTVQRGPAGGGRKKSDPMNQPLTFKNKVKSSGYTQAPRTTMFQPKTNSRSKSQDAANSRVAKGQSLAAKISSQEYPQDAGPPSELDRKLTTGSVPASVTRLKFSATGQHLACTLSNKTALVFPAPFGQKDSSVYVGHDSSINSIHWSSSGKYFLTASNDKTAMLWDRGSGESLLTFNSIHNNFKETQGGDKAKTKDTYPKEVKGAQFFYMDKFVLIIMGNQLCMYKYHLDPAKDDIRRYLTKSKYKLVKSWETASQNFTALAAANTFYSHLAVCAGSNRGLEIFDLNEGRVAHVFSDAHAKPVHSIALNEGSTYTTQPAEALNVFATSSTLDGIKLWDVRGKRCVLRLQGHSNQAHGCGIAFSACGTYLGSGSEDKTAYVYDVRQGTFCQKLRGHTDVVSSVVFHPARPLLASGTIDGKVLLFKA